MNSSVSIAARLPAQTAAKTATALASLGLTLGLALALTGCSGDGTTFGDTHGAPPTGVYVIQNTPASGTTTAASGTILQFSSAATGVATPVSTIANLNVTSLNFLAVDATGNIYTTASETATDGGTASSSLIEFPVDSSNNAQPTRSIPFNATTQIAAPNGLASDPAGDLVLPEASGSVAIFSSTATGSVAPTFTIPGGGATTLVDATAAAVDTNNNLYLIDAGTGITNPIVVFNTSAAPTGAPIRSIGGPLTTLAPGSPQALATDTAGNLYVTNVVSGVSSILVFEPTANGNTPPLRNITGSSTGLGCIGGIAVDTEGSYLYVVSTPTCGNPASPTVLKFSTTGDGNIAPVSTFTATTWTNADPTLSIAVH
jgi:sugar lactone lactonase YvrE